MALNCNADKLETNTIFYKCNIYFKSSAWVNNQQVIFSFQLYVYIFLFNIGHIFQNVNETSIFRSCRGEDTKKLVFGQIRKSVSAEVNYGIRFQNSLEAETFLQQLAREVHNRLQEVNMKAKLVTLKLMVRNLPLY